MNTNFKLKHLLGIRELSADQIVHLLDTAESFRDISKREIKKVPALRGRTVINLFFESSTRTRTSFEIAAKRLSADAVNIRVQNVPWRWLWGPGIPVRRPRSGQGHGLRGGSRGGVSFDKHAGRASGSGGPSFSRAATTLGGAGGVSTTATIGAGACPGVRAAWSTIGLSRPTPNTRTSVAWSLPRSSAFF